jgi:hypothetical protein
MRERSNPNYVKFGKTETVVQFTRDRGELRTNNFGEFFFRELMDGRFTCAASELERRLADLGYTANQRVGITKQTHNRAVIWKVRLIDAPRPISGSEPRDIDAEIVAAHHNRIAVNGGHEPPRAITAIPARPIPESKYAPAPQVWPELETRLAASLAPPTKPAPGAVENRPTADPQIAAPATPQDSAARRELAGLDHVCDSMQHCLTRALDMICAAQKRAVENGCPISFLGADVQDLASTIYIQLGKQANINLMNRNDDLRRNGGGADPWRH